MLVIFTLKKISGKKWTPKMSKISVNQADVHLASAMNNEKVSQLKISKASGVSVVTIRDRSKKIKRIMGGEING